MAYFKKTFFLIRGGIVKELEETKAKELFGNNDGWWLYDKDEGKALIGFSPRKDFDLDKKLAIHDGEAAKEKSLNNLRENKKVELEEKRESLRKEQEQGKETSDGVKTVEKKQVKGKKSTSKKDSLKDDVVEEDMTTFDSKE